MSESRPPHLLTANQPAAAPWAQAVSQVLADRDPGEEQAWSGDAREVIAALQGLVDSGGCVATGVNGTFLPVERMRAFQHAPPYEMGKPVDPASMAKHGVCLIGADAIWVVPLATLTYLPGRQGAPAERVVFHLAPGAMVRGQHTSPGEPKALYFTGTPILLTDASMDVEWLLSPGIDIKDLDALGEVVRGGRRASFEPMKDRISREQGIAQIRQAYERHRGPKPRALRQDDVDVIVRVALQVGLLPNLELVHAATGGRGSPNSVYPKIHDAVARIAPPNAPSAEDIDPALVAAWDTLRRAAAAAGQAVLAREREDLATQLEALGSDRAALAVRERDLIAAETATKAHIADLSGLLTSRDSEIKTAQTRLAAESKLLTRRTEELERLQRKHTEMKTELRLATDRADAAKQTAEVVSAEADARIETLTTAERAQLQAIARLEAERDGLQIAIDKASRAHAALAASHATLQQTADGLRDALATARAEAAAASDAAREARQACDAALAEADDQRQRAESDKNDLRDRVTILAGQLAEARAEQRAAQRERDRLDELVARWGGPAPAPLETTPGDAS
ncbi:MAG: DNA-binding protein [Rhodanobacter sp.]